ncbi:hypothetical protein PoB_005180100 [Plakobranchus ocellatus]|uniref:Uncharacterized protein n=1 Tax=Plakobranchus ocellatus TaxID=259542 RepID=A0AAV4BXM5_9GAST|nr:hypothetical protein PoB_005180100 [Plakobranchus ocellatus]
MCRHVPMLPQKIVQKGLPIKTFGGTSASISLILYLCSKEISIEQHLKYMKLLQFRGRLKMQKSAEMWTIRSTGVCGISTRTAILRCCRELGR